jgi:hypothetical protein
MTIRGGLAQLFTRKVCVSGREVRNVHRPEDDDPRRHVSEVVEVARSVLSQSPVVIL